MSRTRAAVATFLLLLASASRAPAQPLAARACCFTGRCGACEDGATASSFCGASEARCSRCRGEWCGSDAGAQKGAPFAAAVAPAALFMKGQVPVASAFCCFYSPASVLEDRCRTCTSMADAGHWCSASRERCEDNCAGFFCAPSPDEMPPVTTAMPTTTKTTTAPTTATPTTVLAMTQVPMTTEVLSTRMSSTVSTAADTTASRGGSGSNDFCCFYSADLEDKCGACSSRAPRGNWCNESRDRCEGVCSGFFCSSGGGSGSQAPPEVMTPTSLPAPATTPMPTAAARTTQSGTLSPTQGGPSLNWIEGTWTTGYWDCMKPSCSWPGKGSMTNPVRACSAESRGRVTVNALEPSAREGGQAVSCLDNQPFSVSPKLSFGFAAAAVSGQHGLNGDENCGQCFALKFTDQIHRPDNWGGAHPDLVGHTMIIQVTNIGYDVSGVHSFDLQIPSAGQGAFTNGCVRQFPGFSVGDFDCDNNYGGCSSKEGCARQPLELQAGCAWRYDIYKWLEEGGRTNNPYVRFARVQCPENLIAITGSAPLDDAQLPVYTSAL